MPLFVWRANKGVLKRYGNGWIVVGALDPTCAREFARDAYQQRLAGVHDYLDDEDRAYEIAIFETIIATEPEKREVVLIPGSE